MTQEAVAAIVLLRLVGEVAMLLSKLGQIQQNVTDEQLEQGDKDVKAALKKLLDMP